MMSASRFFVSFLSLMISTAIIFAADNMVRNPGFEKGVDRPADWFLGMEGAGAGSARWAEDNPHSGKCCVRLELKEAGDYWMARQTYPKGSAKPNRLYRIRGWRRATNNVCTPCVYFRDGENRFRGAWGGTLPPSKDWRPFDIVFKSNGACDHFELQLRVANRKGVGWFDDVAIEEANGVPEKCKALVAPLLTIAEGRPDYFWAIVSNNGSAEFRLAGNPPVELAWAVANTDASLRDYGIRVERLRGDEVCDTQSVTAPANRRLTRRTFAPATVRDPVTATHVIAFSNHVGPRPILLLGLKATKEAAPMLVDMKAVPVSTLSAAIIPSEPRILHASPAKLDALRRQNPNALPRQALGLSGDRAAVVVASGWRNFTGKQWMDWLLKHPDARTNPPVVAGARNEYVSLQVLCAHPGRIETATAKLSDLRGPAGATIPASAGQVRLVDYVPIGYQWLPDPLLEEQPFKPRGNGPLVFWVTVHIPKAARPGLYRGTLTMQVDPGKPASADIKVRVWNFALPDETHLRTSFWFFRSWIRKYFDLKRTPSVEACYPYLDLATSHRLSPIDMAGNDDLLVKFYREPDGRLSYDFSEWDKYLDRLDAGRASTIHIGFTCHMAGYFSGDKPPVVHRKTGKTISLGYKYGSREHLDALADFLRAAANHLRKRGELNKAYLQLFDEPGLAVGGMAKTYMILKGLKERAPEIRRMVTRVNPEDYGGRMAEVVNHWCPVSVTMGPRFDKVRQRGDTLWWYVCCNPGRPFANLFTHWKIPEMRVLFWQTWQHDLTGLLYWGLNYWGLNEWRRLPPPEERFPKGPWLADVDRTGAGARGDGYFIYPGPTVDRPLSSIRLETIRDGIEDYEMLYLLNSLVDGNPDAASTTLARAREILKVRPAVSKSLSVFDRTGEAMEVERQAIAELIEQLQLETHP